MIRISPTRIGVTLGLISFLFVTTATASHYELEDVRFFSPEEIETFEGLGIEGTDGLLHELESPKKREVLAQRTGITQDRLQELASFTDLLQIRGVGMKMARLFLACGLKGTSQLARRKAAPLLKEMTSMNDRYHISEILPNESMVGKWIKMARKVPVKLKL
jgi:hypothetical protein